MFTFGVYSIVVESASKGGIVLFYSGHTNS